MHTGIVLVAAVLVSVGAKSSRADEIDAVLARCRTAIGKEHAILVTLERRRGTWQITAAPGILDAERLAAIGTIEDLEVWEDDRVSAEWCRKLANLRTLHRLDLSHIRLSEKQLANLRPLKGVEELDLHLDLTRPVTEAALKELKGLSNVRSLTIFDVSAAVVSALSDLPHLEHLETSVSHDAGGKVDLSVLRGLKWLNIHYADPSQAPLRFPEGLQRLGLETNVARNLDLASAASVECVDIEVSPHSGIEPELQSVREGNNLKWLKRFPKLRELAVTHGDLGQIQEIAKLTGLRALTFCTCCEDPALNYDAMRSGEDFNALAALRELQSLSIRGTVTEAGMRVLRDLPNLRCLVGVNFTTATVNRLGELKQLESLGLDLNASGGVAGSLVAAMQALPALQNLSLYGTVTNDELSSLYGLKKLRHLDLSRARGRFTEASIRSLMRSMPQLEQVKCIIKYRQPTEGKGNADDPFQ